MDRGALVGGEENKQIGQARNKLAYISEFKSWLKAAEQGDISAMLKIGKMYRDGGEGVGRDNKKAIKWYQKAADQGNIESAFEIGYIYQTQGITKKHLNGLKKLQIKAKRLLLWK